MKKPNYRMYNDWDESIIVCGDCFGSVNEGLEDDRSYYRLDQKTTKTIEKCQICDEG
jgi:hypothetical protein